MPEDMTGARRPRARVRTLARIIISERVENRLARPVLAEQLAEALTEAIEDWFFEFSQQLAEISNMGGSDAPPLGTPEPE